MSSDYLEHVRELLAAFGTIRARRMFGAWGLYCDELFFALIADERLYLKVDAATEPAFRDAGCEPFVYQGQSRPISLGYWSVPDEAFDAADAMQPWARLALAAAQRAAASKATGKAARGRAPAKRGRPPMA